ncbi:MAG TPA: peptidase [Cyanobacteria bacterium UBA11991]|nr:type II toxin-antitoxin system RelE/ParE family toxin [Cyanobacteriota bacterium]MDY6358116.1 type II toxin-antitoxin system RelE/ParE family toxin [Cyanobacteriota bacterium]MDY6365012.1 type II toxin-antitoxin system RelE/ParE family toxin [Cyanobacteriota bacterium]MDY6382321.1 type II toxin-antitoxin system RelE/ParE family toxin [Cyanobacteriota bacterium]HCB11749.1 peptidase [Cyanobacteria bacterium UBA11991]
MIKSFKHKGLELFYTTGSTKGIQAIHVKRIRLILDMLNSAYQVNDLTLPPLKLHKLQGNMKNLYSVTVQTNWRITFEYDEETQNAYIVDYQNYH